MVRSIRVIVFGVVVAMCAGRAWGEGTPAPPDWQDGRGASVYLGVNQQAPSAMPTTEHRPSLDAAEPLSPPQVEGALPIAPQKSAAPVQQAVHQEVSSPAGVERRRLAPPSNRMGNGGGEPGVANVGRRRLIDFGVATQSIYTVATGLAIVVGAFFVFAWVVRRGSGHGKVRNGTVPADAVSVLGRVPLAARQFAQLVRVGNKLVLVAMTPSGPTTLTEVTDPVEVDRLLGLCQQHGAHSTTKAFEQVFQQFSNESASGFLGDESLPSSFSPVAMAYGRQQGVARV